MPRKEWTPKQERKYEHIKESEKGQGRSTRRAKEIAARTVQKERARRGQTKTASRTSLRGIPSSRRGGLVTGIAAPPSSTTRVVSPSSSSRSRCGAVTMARSHTSVDR